jgi:AcrR family transcriptional regulator
LSGDPITPTPRRPRNAARTRQLLLEVARVRFTRDGYAATTVRDIADDAGVNVALINRYFTSKEGLFEACLGMAVTDLRHEVDNMTPAAIAARIVERIAGPADDAQLQGSLLMLLRTTGDERIDTMRRTVLETVSARLAAATNGAREGTPERAALIRAQVVLATAIGITLLRSSLRLMPLADAGEEELTGPVTDLINALLPS